MPFDNLCRTVKIQHHAIAHDVCPFQTNRHHRIGLIQHHRHDVAGTQINAQAQRTPIDLNRRIAIDHMRRRFQCISDPMRQIFDHRLGAWHIHQGLRCSITRSAKHPRPRNDADAQRYALRSRLLRSGWKSSCWSNPRHRNPNRRYTVRFSRKSSC